MDPILPTPRPHNNRRQYDHASGARILRSCIFALILILVFGIFKQKDIPLPFSGYVRTQNDRPIEKSHEPNMVNEENGSSQKYPEDWNITSSLYQQDTNYSPAPIFGKCTASFGDPDPPYEAAIVSHSLHNQIHGYPHFILREHMIRGLWAKHGWLMTIIGQELAKPEEQRLQWLLWHDRDTVIMNPRIPLSIFVPPEPEFSNIHLLVTKDRNGLNNGVFMVRVNQWAFKLFASALSIREYQPEIPLKYTEQSGMEVIIQRPWWSPSVAYVPQRWFNGFPPDTNIDEDDSRAHSREGSLLIHFASNRDGKRPKRMAYWGEIATNRTSKWDKAVNETLYQEEIVEFWKRVGSGESYDKINKDIGGRAWKTKMV